MFALISGNLLLLILWTENLSSELSADNLFYVLENPCGYTDPDEDYAILPPNYLLLANFCPIF